MLEITIRELRNNGGRVLERVARGESLTITRDGHAVAQLRPLPRPSVALPTLLERARRLPALEVVRLRADLDRVIDSSL